MLEFSERHGCSLLISVYFVYVQNYIENDLEGLVKIKGDLLGLGTNPILGSITQAKKLAWGRNWFKS